MHKIYVLFETVPVFIYSLIIYLYDVALCSEHTKW